MLGIDPETAAQAALHVATGSSTPEVRTTTGLLSVIIQLGTLIATGSGIAIAWMRFGPKWRETAEAARLSDIANLRQTITEVKAELGKAMNKIDGLLKSNHDLELRDAYRAAAFTMVCGELARQDPGNSVLKQALDLNNRAVSQDFGYGLDIVSMSEKVMSRAADIVHDRAHGDDQTKI